MDRNADGYEDIINLPRPNSSRHPRMSLHDRAAQFSPFAALTGYHAAIQETDRWTDPKTELAEYELEELNLNLRKVMDHISEHPEVNVVYFQPDSRKEGGAYVAVKGRVKRIEEYEKCLLLTDGLKIPLADIQTLDLAAKE